MNQPRHQNSFDSGFRRAQFPTDTRSGDHLEVDLRARLITGGTLALILLIQVVPVNHANPPVLYEIPAPDEALAVLRRSCYDCHSNETRWPWYSRVAPISWLIAHDVNEAREAMNFSEWDGYAPDEQRDLLDLILEEIDNGRMPLWHYPPLHPEAQLSDKDLILLRKWISEAGNTLMRSDARR